MPKKLVAYRYPRPVKSNHGDVTAVIHAAPGGHWLVLITQAGELKLQFRKISLQNAVNDAAIYMRTLVVESGRTEPYITENLAQWITDSDDKI